MFALCFIVAPLAHSLLCVNKSQWKSLISESNWSWRFSVRAWQAGNRRSCLMSCFEIVLFFSPSVNENVKLLSTPDKSSCKFPPTTRQALQKTDQNWHWKKIQILGIKLRGQHCIVSPHQIKHLILHRLPVDTDRKIILWLSLNHCNSASVKTSLVL